MNSSGAKISVEESGTSNQQENQGFGNLAVEGDDMSFPENGTSSQLNSKSGTVSTPSNICHYYETKVAALIRKNGNLEGQLAAAVANQEAAEKSLASVLRSRQEMEKKLGDMAKEMELMREKLAGVESAQEEANSLSSIVHSDNVRLEHDVAFLKAVLDDTQKVYTYIYAASRDGRSCNLVLKVIIGLLKICCRSCIQQEEFLLEKEPGHSNYR